MKQFHFLISFFKKHDLLRINTGAIYIERIAFTRDPSILFIDHDSNITKHIDDRDQEMSMDV